MPHNKRLVLVIPHSHTWFWTQTCLACLQQNPPKAKGFDVQVVVVDNSPWSPAIRGVKDTTIGAGRLDVQVVSNPKSNKFHASALDHIVEKFNFDYLMAWETDVLALRPGWLQWFVDHMRHSDYAVGMWHHEQFVNPSCTLYRGSVLTDMACWSSPKGIYKEHLRAPQDELRWGPNFSLTAPLDHNLRNAANPAAVLEDMKGWIGGPFAEKRGWQEGTVLKETPSGQLKGPGWYEPGQQLHHWAVEKGFTYTVCPSLTTSVAGVPVQTMYGYNYPDPQRQLDAEELFGNAQTAHLWGGTRALDIIKHPVTCEFVKANTPGWLAREARFWKAIVPPDIQEKTLSLIRKWGWHYTGQGTDYVSDRDREAAKYIRDCYRAGGVEW